MAFIVRGNLRRLKKVYSDIIRFEQSQIAEEFASLKGFYDKHQNCQSTNIQLQTVSMGMSSDYQLAIENGSNMVRVGSSIFGQRNYS